MTKAIMIPNVNFFGTREKIIGGPPPLKTIQPVFPKKLVNWKERQQHLRRKA
jgi:hypothetical protein